MNEHQNTFHQRLKGAGHPLHRRCHGQPWSVWPVARLRQSRVGARHHCRSSIYRALSGFRAPSGPIPQCGNYIDEVASGEIILVDNQGRDGRSHSNSFCEAAFRKTAAICDEQDQLLPQVTQLLCMARDYPLVISSGHASRHEVMRLVDAADMDLEEQRCEQIWLHTPLAMLAP